MAYFGLAAASLLAALPLAAVVHEPERLLSALQLREDVRLLSDTIDQVHPNPYFRVSQATVFQNKEVLLQRLNSAMTVVEFYRQIAPFVDAYGDDHTELAAPDGAPSLKPAIAHPYAWAFRILPNRIGYLDFAYMADRIKWQAFLDETFGTLQREKSVGLIVDLRTNTGGDSRLGDDLLAYLTDKPYRSIARKRWRFSAPYLAQLDHVDPWGFALASPDQDPPADFKALLKQQPAAAFRAALRERAPAQAKAVLQRRAPHWLAEQVSAEETETLTLEITEMSTPRANMPLRFHGPVVFLIGAQTFSSAVILANTVEDFALAPLIGEETKPCNQFGEPCTFQLPNSGLRLAIATAQYTRANGDDSDRHGVRPSIVVRSRQPAHDATNDVALVRAQALIQNQLNGTRP